MNSQKMLDIMAEVNRDAAEREELVECIAIALLTGKNLFILGDTGQAKSYCVNQFRKRITGARQFERLMSKQTDEEQLFGRLDLSSLIPGSMPRDELMRDPIYAELYNKVEERYRDYIADKDDMSLIEASETANKLENVKRILCHLKASTPKVVTDGKIPDSDIVFLDEIFKANDGILNSLLTALNERVYTNEGQTVNIPVISFFSASNEIPDFSDPAQQILKPLYDRFELKVLTNYVTDKTNRMEVLERKQNGQSGEISTTVTLAELNEMQREVAAVKIPPAINELMDSVLCELRKAGIHVSDRRFFGFYPVAQAKAWLRGAAEVSSKDLLVLKNYFWNKPEEIQKIAQILFDLCENPIGAEIDNILSMAYECKNSFDNDFAAEPESFKSYVKFSTEILRIYIKATELRADDMPESDENALDDCLTKLEDLSVEVDDTVHSEHVTLQNRKRLSA